MHDEIWEKYYFYGRVVLSPNTRHPPEFRLCFLVYCLCTCALASLCPRRYNCSCSSKRSQRPSGFAFKKSFACFSYPLFAVRSARCPTKMELDGVSPDVRSYSQALRACRMGASGDGRAARLAQALVSEMEEKGLGRDMTCLEGAARRAPLNFTHLCCTTLLLIFDSAFRPVLGRF